MREIKFRYLTVIDNTPEWHYINFQSDNLRAKFEAWESVKANSPLLQYIDIKDKNGKEVYEGDGVRFVGGTCDLLPCSQYSSDWHKLNTILIVRKLDSGFTLSLPKHIQLNIPNLVGNVNNYDLWNHSQSLEVIGNIYDNPELLTKH